MAVYSEFASFYDSVMNNIPYDAWTERIISLFGDQVKPGDIVCELGCGTGEITLRLSKLGYDMIGIDCSEEMLNVAKDKMYEHMDLDDPDTFENPPILFLRQDMREFELYGTVQAFVCVCDSLNYMESTEDLKKVFRLANNYLERNGLFIFDVKTEHFYRDICRNETRVDEAEEDVLIWENEYDQTEKKNYYNLTMFVKESDGKYRRSFEEHIQNVFFEEEITEALTASGMKLLTVLKDYRDESENEPERLIFVAQEGYQEGKLY